MSYNLSSVPTEGLSLPQIQVLAGLSAGLTVAETGRDCNISRQTIYNWLKEPKFAAALNTGKQLYAEDLRDQMLILSRKALKRLESIIDDPKAPPSVALKAALAVLNRPQFPDQGWNLPANINTPRQDRIQETNLAIEIEMKQAELEDLKRKLMMARIKADAAPRNGQNLTPHQPPKPEPAARPKITPMNAVINPGFGQNLTPSPTPANAAGR
jgi:hypothetical protein